MPSTSLEADKVFEELVQEFPPEIEEMAREFKAIVRERKIKTVQQLLGIVLLYCGLDKSMREIAANVTITLEEITDTAIAKRLVACQAWVKAILPKMLKLSKPCVQTERRLIVVDGSCVSGLGAKGTEYCLHIALNLLTLEIVQLIVTDKQTSESLVNFDFQADDIIIGDRGYGRHKKEIIAAHKQGFHLLVRYHSLLPLTDKVSGERVDLTKELWGKSTLSEHSLAVQIVCQQTNEVVPAYLHAFKLPPAAISKARRKIKANAKKKKSNTRRSTLFLAGWLVIVTTLPPAEFPAQLIAQLYRCRWQVEMAIKRFKSVLDVDLLRVREGSPMAQVWLNGKMFYVLLIERRTKRKFRDSEESFALSPTRQLTDWRLWKMIEDETAPMITLVHFWPTQFSPAVLLALAERPRRRKLQSLPQPIMAIFQPNKTIKPISLAA